MKPTHVIDGADFHDFASFIDVCNRVLIRPWGGEWDGNLDAFNDYLNWGEAEYVLVWRRSTKSSQDLGHGAMAAWLRARPWASRSELSDAERGKGPTLYDWILEMIRAQPHVELMLE